MSKTIVLTGPTGFLGKAFVSTTDFPADDLFCILRGGQAYRASEPDKVIRLGDLAFLVQDYQQLEFVHFATHYSQPPSDNKDMLNIVEACLTFPITVLGEFSLSNSENLAFSTPPFSVNFSHTEKLFFNSWSS